MPLAAALLPGVIIAHFGAALVGHSCRFALDAVQVDVVTVTISGQRSPVVVLKESDSSRALPIVIGPYEADAIWAKLANRTYPRPLTHDLLANTLALARIKIRRVVIFGERDGIYHAFLVLGQRGRCLRVDSRPSDAIALALRCGAPILVARHLMASPSAFDIEENPGPVRIQGVTFQGLTRELAARLGVKFESGVLVSDVRGGRFAGILARDDIIVAIAGEPVQGLVDAVRRIQALAPDSAAKIRVIRDDQAMDLTVPRKRQESE
jgi:bifunctional DNase/RNase